MTSAPVSSAPTETPSEKPSPVRGLSLLDYVLLQHRLPGSSALAISSALAAALAIGMIVTLRTQLGLRMLRFLTLIPVVLSLTAVLRNAAPTLDAVLSARPLVNQIDRMENKRLPIAGFRLSEF